jgi:hypothetical protein
VTRSKESEGNQENVDEDKLPTQDEKTGKSETIHGSSRLQPRKSASLSSIPIKDRLDVLQYEDSSEPQPRPSKAYTTPNSIVEAIKRKNEILRGKSRRHTPISSSKRTPPQARQIIPKIPKGRPSFTGNATRRTGTKKAAHQTHEKELTEAPATTRRNRPPPINIILQDPKDTVTLIEKT